MTEIYYTPPLLQLMARRPALKPRLEEVVGDHFPELPAARFGRAARGAYYDPSSDTVRVNSGSTAYVIGHELMHALQHCRRPGAARYPMGERSADLFLFARSPDLVADVWGLREPSYLLRAVLLRWLRQLEPAEGRRLVHEACAEAVRLRAAGRHDYICWAENEIEARIRKCLMASAGLSESRHQEAKKSRQGTT